MLNIKEVIKAVNAVINRNSKEFYSSVLVRSASKPNYNNGINTPKICSLNLSECKQFYNSAPNKDVWERKCPYGFKVAAKSFSTASNHGRITTFSIVGYEKNQNLQSALLGLPRNIKTQRETVLYELENLMNIDEKKHKENKEYVEGLLQTLLIGRIGLSIQSISHQFFTPLQGAMSDVKNIEVNQDMTDSITRLTKNFNSLNKLATEIQLILSTSEEFNTNMLRRVTVHSMIDDIFSSLRSAAVDKNINLNQGYNHGDKSVDAIPSQLNIVLSNIISNAIKYSFKGVSTHPLEVNVNYRQDEEFLIIEITNEGCKITDDEISERLIFNLSYRGMFSKDRQRSGSGSGLYVTDKIVKAHGGKVEVTSIFCGGSKSNNTDRYRNTFILYWPIIIE